jgi:hypothetical protein
MVQRAAEHGLVREVAGNSDRRFAKVNLTGQGTTIVERISHANIAEHRDLQLEMLKSPPCTPRDIPTAQGT